mmetsp:Transcript_111926/g.311584  ORF Transcript_111926/g.311584 Transcript_111926/m.311584 type:complete len:304 (-) Transcript_111926:328-1239(-)
MNLALGETHCKWGNPALLPHNAFIINFTCSGIRVEVGVLGMRTPTEVAECSLHSTGALFPSLAFILGWRRTNGPVALLFVAAVVLPSAATTSSFWRPAVPGRPLPPCLVSGRPTSLGPAPSTRLCLLLLLPLLLLLLLRDSGLLATLATSSSCSSADGPGSTPCALARLHSVSAILYSGPRSSLQPWCSLGLGARLSLGGHRHWHRHWLPWHWLHRCWLRLRSSRRLCCNLSTACRSNKCSSNSGTHLVYLATGHRGCCRQRLEWHQWLGKVISYCRESCVGGASQLQRLREHVVFVPQRHLG